MPQNDKTGIEGENFRLHCAPDGQKNGRMKSETSQETLLRATMVYKHLERSIHLFNDVKIHENCILLFPTRKLSPLILSSTNRIIRTYLIFLVSRNS